MSEFFMYDGDPDKKAYYVRATEMFYAYFVYSRIRKMPVTTATFLSI